MAFVDSAFPFMLYCACEPNIFLGGIKMNDFENMLYEEIKDEILSWEEEGIYAISFF